MATDADVQNAVKKSKDDPTYYDDWFRFTDGKLVPAENPELWPIGLLPDELEKVGFKTHRLTDDSYSYTIDVYAKEGMPHWLAVFWEPRDLYFTVEIIGFPDWLGFRRYIAPILASESLVHLESVAIEALDKAMPGWR